MRRYWSLGRRIIFGKVGLEFSLIFIEGGITARYRRSQTCLVKATCHLPLNVRRIYQIHAITPSGKSGESSSRALPRYSANLIFHRRTKLSSLPPRSLFFIVMSGIVVNNRTLIIYGTIEKKCRG